MLPCGPLVLTSWLHSALRYRTTAALPPAAAMCMAACSPGKKIRVRPEIRGIPSRTGTTHAKTKGQAGVSDRASEAEQKKVVHGVPHTLLRHALTASSIPGPCIWGHPAGLHEEAEDVDAPAHSGAVHRGRPLLGVAPLGVHPLLHRPPHAAQVPGYRSTEQPPGVRVLVSPVFHVTVHATVCRHAPPPGLIVLAGRSGDIRHETARVWHAGEAAVRPTARRSAACDAGTHSASNAVLLDQSR